MRTRFAYLWMQYKRPNRLPPPKKTEVFIDRIANFGWNHRLELPQSNIVKFNTAKSVNENIFYSINEINSAIERRYKVSFEYFDYDIHRERIYRRQGKHYYVDPWKQYLTITITILYAFYCFVIR